MHFAEKRVVTRPKVEESSLLYSTTIDLREPVSWGDVRSLIIAVYFITCTLYTLMRNIHHLRYW